MTSKESQDRGIERNIALRIVFIFLGIVTIGLFLGLRWAGFQWRQEAISPIVGPNISSIPYFNTPTVTPVPAVSASEPVTEGIPDLPAPEPHPIKKQQNVRAAVQRYLEAMQQFEARKRALIHTLIQLSPKFHRLVERRMLESPSEVELDRHSISGNNFGDQRESGFLLNRLPIDDLNRLISSFNLTDAPANCRELHEAYTAHLKAMREVMLQLNADSYSSTDAAANREDDRQHGSEALCTSARLAESALAILCEQNGMPKTFDVAVSD